MGDKYELILSLITNDMVEAGVVAMCEFDERCMSRYDIVPSILAEMLMAASPDFFVQLTKGCNGLEIQYQPEEGSDK